jgi:hypothetical protein
LKTHTTQDEGEDKRCFFARHKRKRRVLEEICEKKLGEIVNKIIKEEGTLGH